MGDLSFLSSRKLKENISLCSLKALLSSNAALPLKERSKPTKTNSFKTSSKLLTKFQETAKLKSISKLRVEKVICTPKLNKPLKWLSKENSTEDLPTLSTLKDKSGSWSSGLPGANPLKLPLPASTIWLS